jgi:uncharacterized protein YecE (DUF72 family)
MQILLGTSGWQYKSWKKDFYEGAPQSVWLEKYADSFRTVEINNAFYRLPSADTFAAWAERTPDDFVFAVKASRFLTHIKRLKDPEEPIARLLEHMKPLGDKLGPVLLQLPPTMSVNTERLQRTLELLTPHAETVVEFRHESWFNKDVYGILQDHGAALCFADKGNRVSPLEKTAPFLYIRLHEGVASPKPCYGRAALAHWVERIAQFDAKTVYVYFNNDTNGCAVRNAATFHELAEAAGLSCSIAPA